MSQDRRAYHPCRALILALLLAGCAGLMPAREVSPTEQACLDVARQPPAPPTVWRNLLDLATLVASFVPQPLGTTYWVHDDGPTYRQDAYDACMASATDARRSSGYDGWVVPDDVVPDDVVNGQ